MRARRLLTAVALDIDGVTADLRDWWLRIFTFGGENVERAIDAVNRCDPAIDAWTPRAALPASATGLRAEVVRRRIFVFTSSAIWIYTPDTDIW